MSPGELIKAVRRARGLSQATLARRAGTSQPVVSAYEHDHRDPTVGTLRKILAAGGAELHLGTRPSPAVPPSEDLRDHGRRLLDVLSLVDAIPARPRARELRAPRLVSR
jgi:transcriptional regulator with XRE-family HTH domain